MSFELQVTLLLSVLAALTAIAKYGGRKKPNGSRPEESATIMATAMAAALAPAMAAAFAPLVDVIKELLMLVGRVEKQIDGLRNELKNELLYEHARTGVVERQMLEVQGHLKYKDGFNPTPQERPERYMPR